MEATPVEQVVVVALATYCVGEPTVSPFAGLLTATFANAGAADVKRTNDRREKLFIESASKVFF
jgi:hypothetical protein